MAKKFKTVKRFEGHYYGDNSTDFWKFINSKPATSRLYLLGVLLQDLEYKVLREINLYVPINKPERRKI